jgi:hypothetical protein
MAWCSVGGSKETTLLYFTLLYISDTANAQDFIQEDPWYRNVIVRFGGGALQMDVAEHQVALKTDCSLQTWCHVLKE